MTITTEPDPIAEHDPLEPPSSLSPAMVHAAELIATGVPIGETAKQTGVARGTLRRWRLRPDFRDYLDTLRTQTRQEAAADGDDVLELAGSEAVIELRKQMRDDPDPSIRQKAAVALLALRREQRERDAESDANAPQTIEAALNAFANGWRMLAPLASPEQRRATLESLVSATGGACVWSVVDVADEDDDPPALPAPIPITRGSYDRFEVAGPTDDRLRNKAREMGIPPTEIDALIEGRHPALVADSDTSSPKPAEPSPAPNEPSDGLSALERWRSLHVEPGRVATREELARSSKSRPDDE